MDIGNKALGFGGHIIGRVLPGSIPSFELRWLGHRSPFLEVLVWIRIGV